MDYIRVVGGHDMGGRNPPAFKSANHDIDTLVRQFIFPGGLP